MGSPAIAMAQLNMGLRSLQSRLSSMASKRIGGARYASAFFESYNKSIEERFAQGGIPPKPIDAAQCAELVTLALDPKDEAAEVEDLLVNRVPPGVDEAAYVKAGFLTAVAKGETSFSIFSKERAVELLGTMQGGYCVAPLVELLDDAELSFGCRTIEAHHPRVRRIL